MKKILCYLFGFLCVSQHLFPQAFQGYTLYGPDGGKYSYLINMSNQAVKTWTHSKNGGYSNYLLPDGSVIRSAVSSNSSIHGGGAEGIVQKYNWAGTLTWEYTYSSNTIRSHHDICPMPNGNVLLIAWEVITAAQAVQAGSKRSASFLPDQIVEIQPVGSNGGNIVWMWRAFNHLIQDYDATKDNYGVVNQHPELLDINMGGNGPSGDWMHCNGISYNPILDQIVFSSHNLNEVYVVDHSTTTAQAATHTGGRFGKGGDLLYRWGNSNNYKITGTRVFDVVHSACWIPAGYPGAGHILAYNNRASSGQSMIVEITPPQDSAGYYSWTPGTAYGPASPSWSYTASGFFSDHLGSNQRMPNGNTVIAKATSGNLFEVTSTGTTVWSYSPGGTIAKIYRYAPDYPGLSQLPGNTINSQIALNAGWNLVSLPVKVTDSSTTTLFPAATSSAYAYNNGYSTASALSPGKGYWIRYPQAANVSCTGTSVGTTIALAAGWNLIGAFHKNVTVAAITTTPSGIITSQFYGYSNGYTTAATLSPGMGYWVRASAAGIINLPVETSKISSSSSNIIPVGTGSITIKDAVGNEQTLYLTKSIELVNSHRYELPPLPPAGVFDIRFSSNAMMESADNSAVIEIKDAVYPLTVTINDMSARISDAATGGKVVNQDITEGNSIVIAEPVTSLSVTAASIPTLFSLEQNYPNPFNPSTRIQFQTAVSGNVKLAVYDAMGNEIAKPVNGFVSAGVHNIDINMNDYRNASSGIYFYRLTAGNTALNRKMIYLK